MKSVQGKGLSIVPWDRGVTEVSILSVIFGVFVGIPLLLFSSATLQSRSFLFYLFLWLLGVFGHADDIREENFKRVNVPDVATAILVGVIVWVVLEATFLINFSLLETTPSKQMTTQEILAFNMAFVITGEELVFRDTLPYYLTMILNRKLTDETSASALAVIISAVSFGTFHIVAYEFDYVAVVKAIVAGIILGFARVVAGLLASYIAHFMFNIINILGVLAIFI